MKKIFLYILAGSLCFSACKKDDEVETYQEPEDINVQNNYDEQAITKFMDENYLDVQGNIKAFSATDSTDDHQKKLSEMPFTKLPSGTVYIIREGAQPSPGKEIKETNVIKIMGRAYSYLATETNGSGVFNSKAAFLNTIDGSVVPLVDPMYYYVKEQAMKDAGKEGNRGYFEIAGFKEAIQKFKAYDDLASEAPYNLQGVIIVPSKAAFARNPHYPYLNMSYRNRSFVFNLQVYNSRERLDSEK
ncbi:hypothetical protein SAMN05421786_10626 [Chryseobacterium ureilyticum]|uniref:Uncharacterized protein n=1 Tax=Chryseobacterium ureilyticum TaxID=373668 RepID=A0A1N7PP17_9FLAO|nr:hypothetical protein [Chryseobacterium ureilyticum]SIT12345.1 hypothetical protein SAMN05421786_10626 [Chryseobacterium ureilyticum]